MKENKKWVAPVSAIIIALFCRMPFLRDVEGADVSALGKLEALFSSYSIINLLIFILSLILIIYTYHLEIKPSGRNTILAIVLACFWTVGEMYCSEYELSGGFTNVLYATLNIFAVTLLLRYLIALLDHFLSFKFSSAEQTDGIILGKRSMLYSAGVLFLSWIPFMILSYPGSLASDTIFQIWQINGDIQYWAHTPLFHTLCLKVFIRIGEVLFHSQTAGFFLCTISQGIFMALVLGYSLQRLYERNCPLLIRRVVFVIYLLTPAYSNMVTTPGKDLAYMGCFLWYILLLEELIHACINGGEKELGIRYWIALVVVQICTALVRKNGIYVIVPSGIILALYALIKRSKKTALIIFLACCILPLAGRSTAQHCMEKITDARPASVSEALSIPFQQTARYLKYYGDEISAYEKEAIDAVLGDSSIIGEVYSPNISDPVKMNYNNDASGADLVRYFKAWTVGLRKHPRVYMDAFLQHVYGWFYPGADNVIRYEVEPWYLAIFSIPPFMLRSREILKRLYEMNGRIPFLSLLENMGLFTWMLFYLIFRKNVDRREKLLLVPLVLSLLICMASPAFYGHPRYGYPVLVSLPFISAVFITDQTGEDKEREKGAKPLQSAE